ncbi:MAG TPA: hypothetical protein VFJ69_11900 [Actinomycetota bacterium]|nr:hypothetical protein [Actinomycetota bacterium]
MRATLAMLALLVALALGGCGGSDEPAAGGGGAAATTGAPAPGGGTRATTEQVVLEDGRHLVLIKTVDPGRRTVTFDLLQWFEGEAAAKAAAEDGEESPPPNDYYIRNVNPRLRTLPVAADAPITVSSLASSANPTRDTPVTLAQLAGYFPTNVADPFWITVERGQVTEITQQYLP